MDANLSAEEYYERIRCSLNEMAMARGRDWSEAESREATDNLLAFMKVAIKIRQRQFQEKINDA